MSNRDSPIENYEELKNFFRAFSARYFPQNRLPPEQQPIALLAILEKRGPRTALKGLQHMITDCIEMSLTLPAEEIRKFDDEMISQGIVGISQIRARYSVKYQKALKRGKIKTDQEYAMLRVIADNLSINVPQDERVLINRLLFTYEQSAASAKGEG